MRGSIWLRLTIMALATTALLLLPGTTRAITARSMLRNPSMYSGIAASVSSVRVVTLTLDDEFAAVQDVTGSDVDPQLLLYPVLHATGSAALADAAKLDVSGNGFLHVQDHPAQMMDAIQRFFRRQFGSDANRTLDIEAMNEHVKLLSFFGLSPQTQAAIITRIVTRPLATSYLRSEVGRVTIQDGAGLLTAIGRDRITQAARGAHIRLLLISNSTRFASVADWRSWLRAHAGNKYTITIGLHTVPKQQKIDVIAGAATHISPAQAVQGVDRAVSTFNTQGVTAGVVKLIGIYHSLGATD